MTKKYRPPLSKEQIEHILFLARTEQPFISTASMSLMATLGRTIANIDCGALVESYTEQPPKKEPDLMVALGGRQPGKVSATRAAFSKEQWNEVCYNKTLKHPEQCCLADLEGAREHKYLNDLMMPEEVEQYEIDEGIREPVGKDIIEEIESDG